MTRNPRGSGAVAPGKRQHPLAAFPRGFCPSARLPVGCQRCSWLRFSPAFLQLGSWGITATPSSRPLFHLKPLSLGTRQSCPGFRPTHRLFFKLQIIFKFKITFFFSETFSIFFPFFKLKAPRKTGEAIKPSPAPQPCPRPWCDKENPLSSSFWKAVH